MSIQRIKTFLNTNLKYKDVDWLSIHPDSDLIDSVCLTAKQYRNMLDRVSLHYNKIIPYNEFPWSLRALSELLNTIEVPINSKDKEYLSLLRTIYYNNIQFME